MPSKSFARPKRSSLARKRCWTRKPCNSPADAGSAQPPAGRTVYGWHVAEGRADIFLTYCTNALVAQKENPGQQIVTLPDNLAVGADYGLTVINGASSTAQQIFRLHHVGGQDRRF